MSKIVSEKDREMSSEMTSGLGLSTPRDMSLALGRINVSMILRDSKRTVLSNSSGSMIAPITPKEPLEDTLNLEDMVIRVLHTA